MKRASFLGTIALPALVLALLTSCKKELKDENPQQHLSHALVTPADMSAASDASAKKLETELLKSVRASTARFHSTTAAIKAGYQADNHCVSVPGLGGMGYHWINLPLVDPVFDPLHPEVLLYAPGPNGQLKLVAVEYIVVNVLQQAPMFGTQPFMAGGTPLPIPHWSLHVWLYENNPAGMFIPFNPNISCQ